MLNWMNQFNICCLLDNQHYPSRQGNPEFLAGVGATQILSSTPGQAFDKLERFQKTYPDWLFGHLSYDLKNDVEQLSSAHPDMIGFPELVFFQPEILLQVYPDSVSIGLLTGNHREIYQQILDHKIVVTDAAATELHGQSPEVQQRFSRQDYLQTISAIQKHIRLGDCYELNFCQEFYLEDFHADPVSIYEALSRKSPNPFSAFYKFNAVYCICASPERFLQKRQGQLFSQPIKGTAFRYTDPDADLASKTALLQSEKERAENVMVVDLVRNDLSKICIEGSVRVEELFGIYSFPKVHQMISTISGKLDSGITLSAIMKACFPMASMTGAPKKRVMELIERYERSRRGIFSGSIGYFMPDGDFDFNVVIRSLMHNTSTHYLSWQTGSAITSASDPVQEYNECLLKGEAIREVLETI